MSTRPGNPGRFERPPRQDAVPSTPALSVYLRDMSVCSLIDATRERELGREIQACRRSIVRLFRRLPATCRRYVQNGVSCSPGLDARVPLSDVQRSVERLQRYARIRGEPRLVTLAAEGKRLMRRMRAALEALIRANLRLVVHIAKRHATPDVPLLDLVQEGNIGLMTAAEKFEHERGLRFSTYAHWWIKQAIHRAVLDKGRTIRIPIHTSELRRKVAIVAGQLTQQRKRPAHVDEIAEVMHLPARKVQEVLALSRDIPSLEQQPGSLDEVLPRWILEDPNSLQPLREIERGETREVVEKSLKSLGPREEEVLRLRYGIGDRRSLTLNEIGNVLHLSRERVRQIQSVALRKLRESSLLAELRVPERSPTARAAPEPR